MLEITIDEIQKKFESLPEDLKWAIMGAKVDENITVIGQESGLNVEQMGQLSLETHMVMFGFTHPDNFEESLKASLNLPDEKIKMIVNMVNEKILKKIREKLINLSEGKNDADNEAEDLDETEEANNENVLKSAGIEIMKEELGNGNGNMNGSVENKKTINSILDKKLTGSFQMPPTKTEYTLPGVSGTNKVMEKQEIPIPKRMTPDPYRETPE